MCLASWARGDSKMAVAPQPKARSTMTERYQEGVERGHSRTVRYGPVEARQHSAEFGQELALNAHSYLLANTARIEKSSRANNGSANDGPYRQSSQGVTSLSHWAISLHTSKPLTGSSPARASTRLTFRLPATTTELLCRPAIYHAGNSTRCPVQSTRPFLPQTTGGSLLATPQHFDPDEQRDGGTAKRRNGPPMRGPSAPPHGGSRAHASSKSVLA